MTAIVTTGTRLFNATQIKASFNNTGTDKQYLFIGKSAPWTDEQNPDSPSDSFSSEISVRRDIMAMKLISFNPKM